MMGVDEKLVRIVQNDLLRKANSLMRNRSGDAVDNAFSVTAPQHLQAPANSNKETPADPKLAIAKLWAGNRGDMFRTTQYAALDITPRKMKENVFNSVGNSMARLCPVVRFTNAAKIKAMPVACVVSQPAEIPKPSAAPASRGAVILSIKTGKRVSFNDAFTIAS